MRTIYMSVTPVPKNGHIPQTITCNFVAELERAHGRGPRFRVMIHFDTSFKDQSRGEVAFLREGKFESLLLLTPSEIGVVREWYGAEPPRRGEWQRHGIIGDMVADCARQLAALGAEIVL